MIQWMSQTSRLQAPLLMFSCLVMLVESFVGRSIGTTTTQQHRSCSAVAFHSDHHRHHHIRPDERDLSWNSTATAMNDAARLAASSSKTVSEEEMVASTTAVLLPTDSSGPSNTFKPTVSYHTLDHWFHILGGMEEERILGGGNQENRPSSSRSDWRTWRKPPSPLAAPGHTPTPSPSPSPPKEDNNKPTDHWML